MWAVLAPILAALFGSGGVVAFVLWRSTSRKLNAEAHKADAEAEAGVLTAAQSAYKDLYDEMRARDSERKTDLATTIGQVSALKDRLEMAEDRQTKAEARERICLAKLATIKAVQVDRATIEDLVNKRVRDAVDHGIASAVEAFGVK